MDRTWIRHQLEEFIELVDSYERSRSPGEIIGPQFIYDALHRAEPTVKRILHVLDPNLAAKIDIDRMAGAAMARNEAHRALGILDGMDEWDRRLAPEAPVLPADHLHPWVWGAAQTLWESRHYKQAVLAAATAVSAHTQAKLHRRDVTDDKLMQEAFSDKPPEEGKLRLRVPEIQLIRP